MSHCREDAPVSEELGKAGGGQKSLSVSPGKTRGSLHPAQGVAVRRLLG